MNDCFLDGLLAKLEQVKNLVVILLTLNKSKKINRHFAEFGEVKLPLGWLLLTFSLSKTPLGETGCLGSSCFLFTGCLSIQFFGSH